MSDQKEILRIEAKRHRARMHVKAEDFERACENFFQTITPTQDKIIAAYWPKGREMDPRYILDEALAQGITCALPVMQPGTKELAFAYWDEKTLLHEREFGIMEPALAEENTLLPDIVIVPLLAFDRHGYRLGHGGGYYDATLAALRAQKEIIAIGLAYAEQACLFNLPVEKHDQKLDWIITEQSAQNFE